MSETEKQNSETPQVSASAKPATTAVTDADVKDVKDILAGVEHKAPELTPERLTNMQTLETEIHADFGPTLTALRDITRADLQPRPDYHLTILGPTEFKILATLDKDDLKAALAKLQEINAQIQKGEGIKVNGIGYIDGTDESKYKFREVDKVKKTAFIALDIPALQAFRIDVLKLPPKDFHVTLGFVGGDIHMQVTGQEPVKPNSPKMRDITAPIPKEAVDKELDPRFASIPLPDMTYGGLDGQMKAKK